MKEALKLALEFLEDNEHYVAENERHIYVLLYNEVIKKCKAALEQPAQRQPLPYEQLDSLWQTTDTGDFELDIREFARAIEAAHGIKEKNQ